MVYTDGTSLTRPRTTAAVWVVDIEGARGDSDRYETCISMRLVLVAIVLCKYIVNIAALSVFITSHFIATVYVRRITHEIETKEQ